MFRAQELIAASRIGKARDRMAMATPYSRAITRAVSALATHSDVSHAFLVERHDTKRAAVLLVASDRGMAGAYSATVIRETEKLVARLQAEGKKVVLYVAGRRAESYYTFRQRPPEQAWTGQSDAPTSALADESAGVLLEAYTALGALAAATENVQLGTLVTGNTYRNPTLLAKAITTLDVISAGRAILGIGTGWFELEHDQLGYDFGTFTDRFEKLGEALQIILPMLAGERQ